MTPMPFITNPTVHRYHWNLFLSNANSGGTMRGTSLFAVRSMLEAKHADAKGALLCRIQAGNLSKSESKTIPVRIAVTHASAVQAARQMVECTEMVMT